MSKPNLEGARSIKCAAYGCPLSGAISGSLKGGGRWYCRFHDGKEVSEFDRVSTRINANIDLIRYAQLVSSRGPVAGSMVETGNAEHRRQEGETWADHVRRLNAAVLRAMEGVA